jgi:hypothetical protein
MFEQYTGTPVAPLNFHKNTKIIALEAIPASI